MAKPSVVPQSFTKVGNLDHLGENVPTNEIIFGYGTAGFRENASRLPFIVFRMGALAGLRSQSTKSVIGLMITASHNPERDNGVKLVDPMGEMLANEWEKYATDLVNCSDDDFSKTFEKISTEAKVDRKNSAKIFCAYDTRNSSKYLHEAAKAGMEWLGGEFVSFSLLTTPQLHYVVRCANDPTYGSPEEISYFSKLLTSFAQFTQVCKPTNRDTSLYVDCANGIGALKLRKLSPGLLPDRLNIIIRNEHGQLNHNCGADFVKIQRTVPEGITMTIGERWASLDGDADRLVYYYTSQDGQFHLLDGDKIAVIFADFIGSTIALLGENDLKIGVVQTAYANGSSTDYIKNDLKVPVMCVPTGVKHLHHAALNFDVGIYFEANGHGTVIFSPKFKSFLEEKFNNTLPDSDLFPYVRALWYFLQIINETVGDALADLLAVEAILIWKEWSIQKWDSLYNDRPSCQRKVQVKDRRLIKTIYDETKCTEPQGLQNDIDNIIKEQGGRAFVRPSGTEDIVRVYAEGETQDIANQTAEKIEEIVKKYCS